MRIVQVVHGLPPQERAGVEILTLELSRALQARGHHVTIIARTFAPECEEFSLQEEQDESGLRIIRIVNNYTRMASFRLHYDNPFFHDAFRRLLDQCGADIVHFQHVQHLSASLIPGVSSLGYPTVLGLHDFFFACHLVQFIDSADQLCPGPQQGERCVACLHDVAPAEAVRHRFTFMTRVLRVPQRVIVPSAFLAQRITDEFPFLHDRLQVIAYGLPLPPGPAQDRRAQPGKMDAVPDTPVPSRSPRPPLRIVYVGVLLPHKGAHVLIDALKDIPADRVHTSFYGAEVAARQAYAEQLREAAAGLSVHWGGVYKRSALQAILAEHDVLVMPVIWEETFSLVIREALQAGLPVIAARRGALPEIIEDGRNGLLFEPENADDLRRCLRRLLDEPGLLDRLKPDRFVWRDADAYAQEVEQTYAKMIDPDRQLRKRGSITFEAVLAQSDPRPAVRQGPDWPRPSGRASTPIRDPQTYAQDMEVVHETVRVKPVEESPHPSPLPEGEGRPKLTATRPVSVCVPTYNGAAFIEETLRSIVNQSYQDFELLIVDDGSTDNTLEIVRSFSDPRIQVHCNPERLGIPANWNRCLDLASGEFVCVFHQDDEMQPDNLERKVQLLSADPTLGFVHSAVETLVDESAPTSFANWIEDATEDTVFDGVEYFRTLLLRGNRVCAPTVMARRHALLEQGGFDRDLSFACDYAMWLRLCLTYRVGFLTRPLVRYRWHGGNASHAYQFERGVEEIAEAGRRALKLSQDQVTQSDGLVLGEAFSALTKLRRWIGELERGKAWLEAQQASWRSVAETQTALIHELKGWIEELETGKAWQEEQQTAQQAWIGELEQGKVWQEEQQASWRSVAETQTALIHELKSWIGELETGNVWLEEQRAAQQAWIGELERGKAWQEEQQASWRSVAETQTVLIHELKGWIEELETGKAWQEEQRANWEKIARQREEQIAHWQESVWGRLETRLKLVKPVQEFPTKVENND